MPPEGNALSIRPQGRVSRKRGRKNAPHRCSREGERRNSPSHGHQRDGYGLLQVLPGLEPGLQGSEPWVLTNYTIEPLAELVSRVAPSGLAVAVERGREERRRETPRLGTVLFVCAVWPRRYQLPLGWCSWLSRMPHTHEVTSSILVPSIFCYPLQMTDFGCFFLVRSSPLAKRARQAKTNQYSSRDSNSGPSVC